MSTSCTSCRHSERGRYRGRGRIQHLLAERLGDLGLTVDLWPIDLTALRADPDYPGEEVDRRPAWGLVATNRPGEDVGTDPPGHVDVVPPGDLGPWRGDPFAPVSATGRWSGAAPAT